MGIKEQMRMARKGIQEADAEEKRQMIQLDHAPQIGLKQQNQQIHGNQNENQCKQ